MKEYLEKENKGKFSEPTIFRALKKRGKEGFS
jgi:hypothetical protein